MAASPGAAAMLPLDVDPKLAWALAHRERFPVDVNLAPREILLRVPGLGTRSVKAILASRPRRKLRLDDLARLRVPLDKVKPFVTTIDYAPPCEASSDALRASLRARPLQLPLLA